MRMARRVPAARRSTVADQVLQPPDETLLDVLDHLLNKGVMATGDVRLGVAGIDLIYLRLSALLCAADRVLPKEPAKRRSRTRPPLPYRRRA
jgi:hypothetical protein